MGISQHKRDRLMKKLQEQVLFLQSSSQAFDSGIEEEAIRIAQALRVMFHQTRLSISLVSHLGFGKKRMLSSARGVGDWTDFLQVELNIALPQPVRMRPLLGTKFKDVSIEDWWKNEPVFSHKGETFSRSRIVLSAANKDGGAHVDDKLDAYYESLCAGEHGIGITGNELRFADGRAPFP